jgi:Zn-dependent peptidase ImmA (M78 family)
MEFLILAHGCDSTKQLFEMIAETEAAEIFLKPEPTLPEDHPALVVKEGDKFIILYKPKSPVSTQLSVLHELSHIELGHLDNEQSLSSSELDNSTAEEFAAEKNAAKLLCAVIDLPSLCPPTTEISTRFESLYT